MLKTIMLSATALLLISAAPASTAARADLASLTRTKAVTDYDACLLHSGCFWASGGDAEAGHWVCPNPQIFMNCLSPADPIVP